jgi:cytochrome c556
MSRTRNLIGAGVAAMTALAFAGSVFAAADPVAARQQIMKDFGPQSMVLNPIARGQQPYDAAKVQAALNVLSTGAGQLGGLFPDSTIGPPSHALPAILANKADFTAKLAAFDADVTAAKAAAGDETAGKAAIMKVVAGCGGCHMSYRERPPGPPAGGPPGGAGPRPPA